MEQTDEQLMAAHQRGDPSAFRQLFERYAKRLATAIGRNVWPKAHVEDLVQQTFLQLHRARKDYKPDLPLRPWLFTIAYNLKRQYFRSQKRHPITKAFDNMEDPTQNTARRAEASILHKALRALPSDQSEAIILHYFEGMTFSEVAQVIGISTSAAKVRAHRGYGHLRKILGEPETESFIAAYAGIENRGV